ncbi:hypothetical protein DPEC_G00035360 [Dallia pectoralis]|uniref:Uncharacterized protein n=1 Tax=Dallia pectoralis TaxID=75939 RepID=A0ACC2HDJ7_DALPE|nr:hypothetical protein DPEC_G00035360 [Dallia pectoralis]
MHHTEGAQHGRTSMAGPAWQDQRAFQMSCRADESEASLSREAVYLHLVNINKHQLTSRDPDRVTLPGYGIKKRVPGLRSARPEPVGSPVGYQRWGRTQGQWKLTLALISTAFL